jgi:hypothetical protein
LNLAVGHWVPRKGYKEHVHGIEGHWESKACPSHLDAPRRHRMPFALFRHTFER